MLKAELDAIKASVAKERQQAVSLRDGAATLITSIDATTALLAKVVADAPTSPPPPPPPPTPTGGNVLWQDNLQTESDWLKWGLYPVCERASNSVPNTIPSGQLGSDAAGASLSRVRDPAGGTGWAMRHYLNVGPGEWGRAQFSLASWTNAAFGAQLAKGAVWIEQEVYIPAPMPSAGDGSAWLSLQDFHAHNADGSQWLHTWPGLFLGSPAVNNCPAGRIISRASNVFSQPSSQAVPIGRWFKLQTHYPWSASPVPVTYYIDAVQVAQITMATKPNNQTQLEFYCKLYGAAPWSVRPLIRYTRNVRIGDALLR